MNRHYMRHDIRSMLAASRAPIVMGRVVRRVLGTAATQKGARPGPVQTSPAAAPPSPEQTFGALVDQLLFAAAVDQLLRPANPWDELTKNLRATRP